jgi:hypothetical protein
MFIIVCYTAPRCLHNRLIHTYEIENKSDMKTNLFVIGVILIFSGLGLAIYHLEMAYAQPSQPSPSSLVGKWNFVVVVKNVSISGTITFAPKTFSETSAGHTVGGTYKYTAGVLNYCFRQGCIQYSQMEGNDLSGMPGMNQPLRFR